MKAVTYSSYGGPEVLEVSELPEPKVGPDSVLINVKAASVNPVDWKIREGYLEPVLDVFFPAISGWDVAGVVERTGPAVSAFAAGDEVIGYVREDVVRRGTFAEQVAAPVTYGEGLAERVRTLAPNGVNAVLDLVGGEALRTTPELLADAGRVVSITDGEGVAKLDGKYAFVHSRWRRPLTRIARTRKATPAAKS